MFFGCRGKAFARGGLFVCVSFGARSGSFGVFSPQRAFWRGVFCFSAFPDFFREIA
jgi:hypothetical protein